MGYLPNVVAKAMATEVSRVKTQGRYRPANELRAFKLARAKVLAGLLEVDTLLFSGQYRGMDISVHLRRETFAVKMVVLGQNYQSPPFVVADIDPMTGRTFRSASEFLTWREMMYTKLDKEIDRPKCSRADLARLANGR